MTICKVIGHKAEDMRTVLPDGSTVWWLRCKWCRCRLYMDSWLRPVEARENLTPEEEYEAKQLV